MSVRIEFSKTSYAAGEPIEFQVVVEGEPTTVTTDIVVNGSIVLPGRSAMPVSGATQVIDGTTYGEFTADGYTVEQDQVDPSRYTAVPQ